MFTTGYYAVIENGRYVAAYREYSTAAQRRLGSRLADPDARLVWVKSALVVGTDVDEKGSDDFVERMEKGPPEPSYSEPTFTDANGAPLEVGTRIEGGGVVTGFTDADADVDEEGRGIYYPPRVKVRYDDGTEDDYSTSWLGGYYDDNAPYQCDDIAREVS